MGVSQEVLELLIKARDEATRDLERTSDAMSRLGDVAANVGVVIGSLAAAKTALDLGQLASSAHRVEASFRAIAGTGADKMLDKLRASSQGTIADMDLMLSANRAMMLGVTKDADEMARLLEIAAVRGQAMGLSTQQAFNDMMTGIGRASPLILDNLGIVTGGQKVYDDYAKSIGKAADELSEMEKKQALVGLVLKQGEGMAFKPDEAAGYEQLSASLANLKVSLGELVNETLRLPQAVDLAAQAITGFNAAIQEGQSRQAQSTEWMGLYRAALIQLRDEGKISQAQFLAQTAAVKLMSDATDIGLMSIADMHQQAQRLNPEMHLLALRTRNQGDEALDGAAANNALAGSLDNVAEAANTAASALGAVSSEQAAYNLSVVRQELRQRENAQSSEVQQWLETKELERTGANRARIEEEARITAGVAKKAASEAEAQAREWANTVKSAVESVFTASTVTERDWWETNLGQYQDKPDEFLRRLRSAATEADSEWKHLLGGRSGDAAQLYLAQQEELWRTGQWSQMGEGFDAGAAREAMVQAAMAKMQADASREAMIADVMSDPRLGGFSAAQRARVLGSGSEAGGATFAEAWVVGAVSADAGKEFTDAFGQQMEAQEARWRVFGAMSAGWIIDGMEGSAETAKNRLVEIIFPGVYDALEKAGVVKTP